MELVSVDCPSCGASLPPREPAGHYQCDYCSSRFELRQARSAKTQAGIAISPAELAKAIAQAQQGAQTQHAQAYQEAARRGRRISLIVFGVAMAAGLIPALIAVLRANSLTGAVANIPGAKNIPGVAQVAEQAEYLLWDDVAGPPQTTTIADKPAFLGRTRKVRDGDQLFVDAYDAATVERIWRVGPLGTYSEGYQSTFFAAAADRAVVSDFRSRLRLLELDTGAEVKTLELTDRVDYLCVPPGDEPPHRVWVKQVDERAHLLDVTTGELTEAKKPKGCATSRWEAQRAREAKPKRKQLPKVEGTKIERVLRAGDLAVGVGKKHPGTPIPRAVGFDPGSKDVHWDTEIPSVDLATVRRETPLVGLAGGRLIATYGAGQDAWHITGLDARSGARLWDTKLRPLFAVDQLQDLIVTDAHALLVRTSSLEVYDTATGTLLGTVGSETYDDD